MKKKSNQVGGRQAWFGVRSMKVGCSRCKNGAELAGLYPHRAWAGNCDAPTASLKLAIALPLSTSKQIKSPLDKGLKSDRARSQVMAPHVNPQFFSAGMTKEMMESQPSISSGAKHLSSAGKASHHLLRCALHRATDG